MSASLPVHGGLLEPVNLTVPEAEKASFLAHAQSLAKVQVSDADLSTIYRLGDGGLSPLTGFMDSATYNRVLDDSVLMHNGKPYAWTIPLSLPVPDDIAKSLKVGQEIALTNSANEIVATMTVSDIFPWDKMHYLKSV